MISKQQLWSHLPEATGRSCARIIPLLAIATFLLFYASLFSPARAAMAPGPPPDLSRQATADVPLPRAPEAATSGREWPTINIRQFGAKGDGQSDDTQAIRRAIVAIGEAGGGVVRIPAGNYRVFPQKAGEDCITINYDNVSLVGEGRDVSTISCYTLHGFLPTAPGLFYRGRGIVIQGTKDLKHPRHGILVSGLRIVGNAEISGDVIPEIRAA